MITYLVQPYDEPRIPAGRAGSPGYGVLGRKEEDVIGDVLILGSHRCEVQPVKTEIDKGRHMYVSALISKLSGALL